MQSLNDDMDDLFKRAGEEYPLNTDGADWNKVLHKLQHANDDVTVDGYKRKNYQFLWLLLLLPIGFVCGRYAGNDSNGNLFTGNNQADKTMASTNKTKPIANAAGKIINAKKLLTRDSASDATAKTKKNAAHKGAELLSHHKLKPAEEREAAHQSERLSDFKTGNFSDKSSKGQKKVDAKNESEVRGKTHYAESILHVSQSKTDKQIKQTDTTTKAVKEKEITGQTVKDTAANVAKANAILKEPFKRHFYYSFLIGPDVSFIKSQKTSKLGYSAGLMVGYRLSKRISVEAGVLWDRKNYYSTGNYLDTNSLKLPARSKVSAVNGSCEMIEVPVNIRYNFFTAKKHSWFVSTGLSSYFMKNEDYNIAYERYATSYIKDYSYDNSSKDWFSILNVSVGYNTSFKKTNVSIAPYLKLPVKNVGIGRLPISSTGIHLVLSRPVR